MMRKLLSLVMMLAVVVGSQYLIAREKADVMVEHEILAGHPVDHYEAVGDPQGVVLVAQAFGGSKELLQYWGYALARQGFEAYLFDLPSEGHQLVRLSAWEHLEVRPSGQGPHEILAELIGAGRAEPGSIALLNPTMAGGLPAATGLAEEVGVQVLTISGDHLLAILYGPEAIQVAVESLRQALGTELREPVTLGFPWPWLLLSWIGGLGALISVATMLRPRRIHSGERKRPLGFLTGLLALAVAFLSAVLVTVYLRIPQPGIEGVDYLIPYFLVVSLVLLLLRAFWPGEFAFPLVQESEGLGRAILAGLLLGLVYLAGLVPVVHMNLAYFLPNLTRLLPMVATLVALWLYSVQEEGLKRAVTGQRGLLVGFVLGLLAKLVMVATWIGASALPNPPVLIDLMIPAALALLIGMELLGLLLRSLRQWPAAIATLNALVLAWVMLSTLPMM